MTNSRVIRDVVECFGFSDLVLTENLNSFGCFIFLDQLRRLYTDFLCKDRKRCNVIFNYCISTDKVFVNKGTRN